jgi:hypothetical protein
VIRLPDDAPMGRGQQGQIESSTPSRQSGHGRLLAQITQRDAIVLVLSAKRVIGPSRFCASLFKSRQSDQTIGSHGEAYAAFGKHANLLLEFGSRRAANEACS